MTISGDAQQPADPAEFSIVDYLDHSPQIAPGVYLAPGARVVGDVRIGPDSSVWFNAVLRGDSGAIRIGERTNVQDNVSVHVAPSHDALIGDDVSIGHNAVVHGCSIGHGSLIGMGAVVLQGAEIAEQVLVAAGSVVLENTVIPPRSLVAGSPATVRRALTTAEVQGLVANSAAYLTYAASYASPRIS